MADQLGMESIDREAQTVMIKFRPDTAGKRLNVERLLKVIGSRDDLTLVPPSTIKMDLRHAVRAGERAGSGRQAPSEVPVGTKAKARQSTGSSWWTAREQPERSRPASRRTKFCGRRKRTPVLPAGFSPGSAVCWRTWPGYNK